MATKKYNWNFFGIENESGLSDTLFKSYCEGLTEDSCKESDKWYCKWDTSATPASCKHIYKQCKASGVNPRGRFKFTRFCRKACEDPHRYLNSRYYCYKHDDEGKLVGPGPVSTAPRTSYYPSVSSYAGYPQNTGIKLNGRTVYRGALGGLHFYKSQPHQYLSKKQKRAFYRARRSQ